MRPDPPFPLLAAAWGADGRCISEPVALAPEGGGEQMVGEASAAAEATGVTAGMRMGEALSRCPGLRLVPPDPEGTRALWGSVLDGIESIGRRAGVRAGRGRPSSMRRV